MGILIDSSVLIAAERGDLDAARAHATLSAELRARGTPVGAHDLLIAATAVPIDYQVATRDLRSFPRIRGLRVLRW